MSGIIKTIKAKDEHDVQHNIFPKTVLEAVVDSETNETLDNIIDELRHGGGGSGQLPEDIQEQIDNKVDKSGDTMTGALNIESPNFSVLNLTRTGTSSGGNYTGIQFNNDSGMLGGLAMNTTSGDMNVINKDGVAYSLLDTRNYKNYKHDSLSYFKSTSNTDVGVEDTSSNAIGYVKVPSLYSQTDGALYKQVYSDQWAHEIYGDYRTGQIAVRGKNNGTWQSWRGVLDSSNYSSYALPLTGGTVSGTVNFNGVTYLNSKDTIMQNGSHCINLTSDGTNGYWKFATIKMTSSATWCGSIISFKISQRYDAEGRVELHINNGSNAGTGFTASIFRQKGNIGQCYIYQSATGVFDLYLARGTYDYVTISDLSFPKYMQNRCDIIWTNTQASLPSGATPATVTNDWTTVITSTSTSISTNLPTVEAGYMVWAYDNSGGHSMRFMLYTNGKSLSIVDEGHSGGLGATISGTTLTITSPSNSPGITLKYIMIR